MARFALSLALISLASALSFGCAASSPLDSSDDGEGTDALASKGCVYTSNHHVIDCVSPTGPTTHNGPAVDPPAQDGKAQPAGSSAASGGGASSSAVCDALAAKLATELAEAQKCEPDATGDPLPECRTFVPTTTGCEAPVNNDESSSTADYMRTWNQFAAVCPVPHPPCVDPELLATACVPSATTGSVGACKVVPGNGGPSTSN
jgi:hypothetical protein